ncbi:ABC transporter permease [Streptacidiphilus monticola]
MLTGLVLLFVFALLAFVGPLVAPHSSDWTVDRIHHVPLAPNGTYWLGTDQQQHDVFSMVLNGGRDTLLIAFIAGLVATVLSVVVGVTAGYLGGLVDDLLTALANIFLALPGLIILMVIMKPLPPEDTANPFVIGAVIALTGWAWGARVLRTQTLALRGQDYVESAKVIGERKWRIMLFEIVPNLLPILASSFIFTVIYGIGIFTVLTYLGLVHTTVPSWGLIISQAISQGAVMVGQWWWFVPPAVCIALVGTALALVNFGIDEVINPG